MHQRIKTTLESARRLAVAKQGLSGKLPSKPDSDDVLEMTRTLGCLQLDPISAVAPSQLIVLWSRIGNFDTSDLDRLLWDEKKLFEYWAHQASIVLTEDYPLYYYMMRKYPDMYLRSLGPVWKERVKKWIGKNSELKNYVLTELKQRGPLMSRQFEDKTRTKPRGFGWGSWSDVSRMIFHLFFKGEIMVSGRQGKQKIWDLSERFLPNWVKKEELSEQEVEYEAVQRSLRALGIANESELSSHFLRGRYRTLRDTVKRLRADSKIELIDIIDGPIGKGKRYIHSRDIELLENLESEDWAPRVSLLSPFDNLICDRTRTKLLFNFDYTTEIYTPQHKRKYGYYVLPILSGDRLIGRLDPFMDPKKGKLLIKAVHAEREAPTDKSVAVEIRGIVEQLSGFLGANEVEFSSKVPRYWKSQLR